MESRDAQRRRWPLIAIVDNDDMVCRAISRLLLSREIRAETFTSSRFFIEVLDAVPSFKPPCVVLDLDMPRLDGIAVHDYLVWSRPDARVIFLTARIAEHERKEVLAKGALAVFRKPLWDDLEAFVEAIMSTLKS